MTVTANTVKHLVLEAGVVYVNYGETTGERVVGATSGEIVFNVERTWRKPRFNGMKGNVKGLARVTWEVPTLAFTMNELSIENFKLAIGGYTTSVTDNKGGVGTTHDEIRSSGVISSADYLKNVAVVGIDASTGAPTVILVENALNTAEGIGITMADETEAGLPVTIEGFRDPANPSKVPYAIRKPKVV